MRTPSLFDTSARFDGPSYDPVFDQARLTKQIGRIFDLMRDGQWRTLNEIADVTGDPPTSISAQLRHLRKKKWGSFNIEKRRLGVPERGLFEYRLLDADQSEATGE